jgi:NADH:ubiquinone oxidoreductase subunit F (NADH-binding)
MDLGELIAALERARLAGHGGAAFPTARKLRAVAEASGRVRRPTVVVNGSEGEPLSRKDRFLLSRHPDTVLDGALAAAAALGADRLVVAVDERRAAVIDTVSAALAARPASSPEVELGGRRRPRAEVVPVPAGFVTGQETALLNFLGGGAAAPTGTPPYPFERGLRGRPTLVSNVETFAQIARVVAGEYDGSRYITVSGAVSQLAVLQVRPGTTVAGALSAAGGVTERVSGVLLGGYGGTWAPAPMALELTLEEASLRARGLTLGAGIVHVLGQSRCAVAEVARISRWMAGQSAGQCGPCVFGLDAIAGALEVLCGVADADAVARAPRGRKALAQIERWCAMVERRGGCAHPDGVSRLVRSALAAFPDAFGNHAAHGPCPRCAATFAGGPGARVAGARGAGQNPAGGQPGSPSPVAA